MDIKVVFKRTCFDHFGVIAALMLMIGMSTNSQAQQNALLLQMDNDYFTDQYYTAGLQLSYLRSINRADAGQNVLKQWILEYGFEIYTPSIYDQESFDLRTQDRPFAGGHSLRGGIRTTFSNQKMQEFGLKVGFVGPQARGWEIQDFFHGTFGFFPEIVGWEEQIADQWIVNLDYQWFKEWRLNENMALSSSTDIDIGLSRNALRQGINLRVGEFKNLNLSSWLSPKRSNYRNNFKGEAFIKGGLGLNYIASNIFIEGSLFEDESPFTVDAKSVFIDLSLGIFIGNPRINFGINAIFRGAEVSTGKSHFYLALIVGKSF